MRIQQKKRLAAWILLELATMLCLAGCNTSAPSQPSLPAPTLPPMGSGPIRTMATPPSNGNSNTNISSVNNTTNTASSMENPIKAQMLLGNPDGASSDTNSREHYLMRRLQYAVSYNDTLHFPNWVAWHLQAKDIGDTDRGSFVADPNLPSSFTRITTQEYTNSGYDRGHNCPSKDRTASREDNNVAFYMTNITPQQHGMNAGPWEGFESYCRELARTGNEVYITCGHGFRDKNYKTIGGSQIAVPDFGWKIAVVLSDREGDDLSRIKKSTRVIALQMPNISTISHKKWQEFITTPAEIEQSVNMTFFTNLPTEVADALRQKKDDGGYY